jgi:hypothetical protein
MTREGFPGLHVFEPPLEPPTISDRNAFIAPPVNARPRPCMTRKATSGTPSNSFGAEGAAACGVAYACDADSADIANSRPRASGR